MNLGHIESVASYNSYDTIKWKFKLLYEGLFNILKFFTFWMILNTKHYKELQAEYNLKQKLPKVKIASPMLIQKAKLYTCKLFLKLQK